MKFLSKLASYLVKGVAFFAGFAPAVTTTFPGTTNAVQTISQDLTQIAEVVTDVERVAAVAKSPMTGEQKLELATPTVVDIVLRSSMLANHKVANPDLFNQGAAKLASGMADIINSLDNSGVEAGLVKKS